MPAQETPGTLPVLYLVASTSPTTVKRLDGESVPIPTLPPLGLSSKGSKATPDAVETMTPAFRLSSYPNLTPFAGLTPSIALTANVVSLFQSVAEGKDDGAVPLATIVLGPVTGACVETIRRAALRVSRSILNELEASLIVCSTGVSRESEHIINQQVDAMKDCEAGALEALHAIKQAAIDTKQALLAGDLKTFGEILNRSWAMKKRTASGVSSQLIDGLFEVGLRGGARAGKISGAGGGGFIMFLTEPERRRSVIAHLNEAGGGAGPVHLTGRGVEAWQARPNAIGGRPIR